MSKELYEEALADVKKLTQVAENNAKRAILDVVTPKIRDLIERELLSEDQAGEDELLHDAPLSPTVGGSMAVSTPDKIEDEAVNCESDVKEGVKAPDSSSKLVVESVDQLCDLTQKFADASRIIKESSTYKEQISLMISRFENMYESVQESVNDPVLKDSLEQKLEKRFQQLKKLQEMTMQLKDLIKEDDAADVGAAPAGGEEQAPASGGELTLKLTGLPADVNLDNVGVDLVAGDEEEPEAGAEAPEGGEELDLGDLEVGSEEGEEGTMESLNLSDDTIVEIDEGMLRQEIARMKKLREADQKEPWSDDKGPDSAVMDDFGGGKEDGDPWLDGSVTTESEDLDEADDDDDGMDEAEEMDEADDDDDLDEQDMGADEATAIESYDMDELQNRRKGDELGSRVADGHYTESLKRREAFEKKLQERARKRVAALKKEGTSKAKKEVARLVSVFKESVKRSEKISARLNETKKHDVKRSNSATVQPAESKAVKDLRNELADKNLTNTKLMYAVKLLQNESMTKRQKANVLARLDEVKTVREAKLVYESMVNTKPESKKLDESRLIVGSSRATKSSSSQNLSEGFESERWLKLAGIAK